MLIHGKKIFFLLSAFLVLALSVPRPGLCHRVNVFCWVEGSKINCEAKFTPGGPVKGGLIEVYSQKTREKLLTLTTDKNGRATFEIPQEARKNGSDLKVVCNAEMGHKNFWVVKAEEYGSVETRSSPGGEKPPLQQSSISSNKELEKALSQVLAEQLAPIKKELAELRQDRISLQDILGGLGYIFGLAGVAFYFLGKKERGN